MLLRYLMSEGKTIKVKLGDYNRILNMRDEERKFIGDVVTYLLDFYEENLPSEEGV